MERRFEVETALGPVWLWGRDTGRPLVVVFTGLRAEPWVYDKLQGDFPDADVLRTHLPGNHCPELVAPGIGTAGGAISRALNARFNRPAVFVGISAGALVALACPYPLLDALVLVEPFLRSSLPEFAGNDYRHLARGLRAPAEILLGDPAATAKLPTMVGPEDRAIWTDTPLAHLTVIAGAGHNVAGHNAAAFVQAIRSALSGTQRSAGQPLRLQG